MLTTEFQNNLIELQGSLMRFAYSLTTDRDDAKDLVQDTTLKALKYYDKYLNESNFKAWTYSIMKNTFINNYRKSKRQSLLREYTSEFTLMNVSSPSGTNDPDSTYTALEIVENIDKLKDMFRIPFQMYVSGYKYKEIADDLNLNIGTVKSRIFFSRKQLRNQLK